ncbi:winged helix-turn-helix domain-containing protein [Sphingomonas sp. QA11]|uniref:winged helix-turn-helix domain-containing protein n=1 Tax=Sphingomonas sp. QA11 TaxID=2950605 RepID=UPI00234BEFF9|nr:winged helix-turn-helix domain-containing protein [Sphingomonas sp. QA11]WCM28162.1 winged helix-turn-helix domain-containing protein [Sphingomonas sp. QA11]
MVSADRIDLAHEPTFALGTLSVEPGTREIVGTDGTREVVEPRVMQVLVALARAKGATLSRDDLTRSCWDGRVVGEDAINRVISRLRRLAEGIGGGRFRIETVTKVGYRLIVEGAHPASLSVPAMKGVRPSSPRLPTRRAIIAGAAGASVAAAGGILWWRHGASGDAAPAIVAPFMQQANMAMSHGDPEGITQAIGLFRRAVEIRPDYADGWGALAGAYAAAARTRPSEYIASMEERARAAAERALSLDPRNAYAKVALIALKPRIGNWQSAEQVLRQAMADHPDSEVFMGTLSSLLSSVGRMAEAAILSDRIARIAAPSPGFSYSRVQLLWAAGRLEEADRAMDDAFALYPMHYAVWFTRFQLLTYTGRAREAIAFGEERGGRPTGIPEGNFDLVLASARAIASGARTDIDAAIAMNMAAARRAAGQAENTIQFAGALGRLDDAFALADAYFFGRGFRVGDVRFTEQQGGYTRPADRRTVPLFMPTTGAMRADPRFERLATEIGLTRYWAQSGIRPDYKKAR